jgi:hypothetical protein
MRKHALKMLGLCVVAALSLMAFSASAAQAEVGANWDVNGLNNLPAQLKGKLENKTGTLLTEIAGVLVHILCTAMELKNAELKAAGTFLGLMTFTGCITLMAKLPATPVLSKPCQPLDKTKATGLGTILTLELKGLIKLHSGEGVVEITPDTGSNAFGHFEFDPEECSLPASTLILGKIFLKDSNGSFKTAAKMHLMSEHSLTHLYVISDTPEHAAKIDGSVELELAGAHTGMTWAGLPA